MLKNRPFEKLYKDDHDKWLQKLAYHQHRAVECLHKLEKIYYGRKDEKNTNSNLAMPNKL
jgi:hypothetical protein